jgi:hypothetical protein
VTFGGDYRRLSRMTHCAVDRALALGMVVIATGLSAAQAPTVNWRSEGLFLASATDVAIDPLRPETVDVSTTS